MSPVFDNELLRTFVAIADSGGFTRAAELVHRSQSAVSMQMKKLEEMVGRPLFEKVGRSMVLTPDGEILLNYARRILRLHDEAVSTLQQPDMVGSVRIGIPDDYVAAFIPRIMARFAKSYPMVQVEVICNHSEHLTKAVKVGEIDLAIVTSVPGSMEGDILRREATVWATSKHHFIHEEDPLPLVLFQPGCIFRHWAMKALDKVDRPYRVAYSSPSITGIEAIVGCGLGVTVLVNSIVNDSMRVLTTAEGFPLLPESAITLLKTSTSSSPAMQCLADYIVEGFRDNQANAA
ncbi:MAG: LysR substrate-binding domain-containing protein [Sedimenticola sp.]|nr:LysR substrate-binding domain-containing protein [Sedimenticola sp.]